MQNIVQHGFQNYRLPSNYEIELELDKLDFNYYFPSKLFKDLCLFYYSQLVNKEEQFLKTLDLQIE